MNAASSGAACPPGTANVAEIMAADSGPEGELDSRIRNSAKFRVNSEEYEVKARSLKGGPLAVSRVAYAPQRLFSTSERNSLVLSSGKKLSSLRVNTAIASPFLELEILEVV